MFSIQSNSNKIAYGIKKFVVDSITDINSLPTNIAVGSEAFVIENSIKFMLNNKKQWVKISTASSESGGSEEITSGILDGGLLTQ